MYPPMRTDDAATTTSKPMNCPFHVLIYKSQTRSYRDLPMRLSELGTRLPARAHRDAARPAADPRRSRRTTRTSSARPDQLVDEILRVFDLTLRDPSRRSGSRSPSSTLSTLPGETIVTPRWPNGRPARSATALERSGLEYRGRRGRGVVLRPEGRLPLPRRDRAAVAAHDGAVRLRPARAVRAWSTSARTTQRHRPVMIHRAILGSLERFSAVLIEHYGGRVPALALARAGAPRPGRRPARRARARARRRGCATAGLRPEVDESGETVGKKVRAAQLAKAPYVLVIGDKEIESGELTVRDREGDRDQGRAVRRRSSRPSSRRPRPGASTQSRFGG